MKYHLVALLTILVWGLTFVSTKVLLVDFTPLQILAIRFVIGTIALCTLRPHIMHLHERRHEWLFVLAGATGIAAYYLLENIALVFTTATAVGVIVAASPLFTAIIAMTRGDRSALNVRFVIGFLLAMGGLVLVGVSTGGEDAMAAFHTSVTCSLSWLPSSGPSTRCLSNASANLATRPSRPPSAPFSGVSSSSSRQASCSVVICPRRARHLPGIMSRICFSWD